MLVNGIPADLKCRDQWVIWNLGRRGNGWAKQPLMPSGKRASVTSPSHWSSFDDVSSIYAMGACDGIGFCLSGDGLVFVDYDSTGDALEASDLGALAVKGWTERSPSGRGLHTVVIAEKRHSGCRYTPDHPKIKAVEIYDDRRFFTVTGHTVGTCTELLENQVDIDRLVRQMPGKRDIKTYPSTTYQTDEEVLRRMMRSPQWVKIARLWSGIGVSDHSSADLSLMNHIGYWANYDPEVMERLFSASALGQRSKWQDRGDYRERTVRRAIQPSTEHVGDG